MVHYSLVKMTSQMVFALLVKKTTLITLNMLKSTCPKWKGVFLAFAKFGFLYQFFQFGKPRILVVHLTNVTTYYFQKLKT
jgi:hypothetical protein